MSDEELLNSATRSFTLGSFGGDGTRTMMLASIAASLLVIARNSTPPTTPQESPVTNDDVRKAVESEL